MKITHGHLVAAAMLSLVLCTFMVIKDNVDKRQAGQQSEFVKT